MPKIETLVEDIQKLLSSETHETDPKNVEKLGSDIAKMVSQRLSKRSQEGGALRMSSLGGSCDRKLYYKEHHVEHQEDLSPSTRLKFMYGDILELLLLFFAREAGHEVTGEQDVLEIDGVIGHRDAIIDGVQTDVKSASTYSFNKFKNHELLNNDPFGYIVQNNSYRFADPTVDQTRVAFLAVDKQHGHIVLDMYPADTRDYREIVAQKRDILGKKAPPPRPFFDEPKGKSGNRGLGVECSYCDFKNKCWPGLRTFLYSNGPEFLTKVVKVPNVPEA